MLTLLQRRYLGSVQRRIFHLMMSDNDKRMCEIQSNQSGQQRDGTDLEEAHRSTWKIIHCYPLVVQSLVRTRHSCTGSFYSPDPHWSVLLLMPLLLKKENEKVPLSNCPGGFRVRIG